ncbi:MAG: metalloprotease PmbA [Methylococcaceae bacterium]
MNKNISNHHSSSVTSQLDELKNVISDVVASAKNQGATEVEAELSLEKGLSVTARLGEVETIEHHFDQGLGLTVYFGKKKGSASTTDLRPNSIQEALMAACSIAKYASEDQCAGLPEQDLLATEFYDLDLYHPWSLDAEQAVQIAIECEDEARNFHPDISNSEGASVNSHEGVRIFGNSLGFLHGYPSTRQSLSCSVLGQQDKSMQRDYWYTIARNAEELETPKAVGIKAAERTIKRLGAHSISNRQCPALFSAEIASSLIGHFIGAIRGGNLYRKSSFLLDAMGQQIFPSFVHIQEQPHLQRALGSALYDSEGVATSDKDLVNEGLLKSYVLSTYSARKLGLQTTANAGGLHNLIIDPGRASLDELLAQMDTGLLVTELMGQGVNTVTGDYSRGAAGYWVEQGQIQYPVEEITIAGNLKNMFKNIVAIGNDVDFRGNTRTGSILLEQMTVAGE